MRIRHYYPRFMQERSGVTAAVAMWAHVHTVARHDVMVLHGPVSQPRQSLAPGVKALELKHLGRSRATYLPLDVRTALRDTDLLVLHEGWVASNLWIGQMARRLKVPYVVMPHGAYERPIREGLRPPLRVRREAERRLLQGALAVHNSFDSETPLLRSLGVTAPSVCIPTPVSTSALSWRGGGGYLAWFGRFAVEHKGLDLLARALACIPENVRPRLQMAGSDYEDGKRQFQRLVADLELQAWVTVAEPRWGRARDEWLSLAEGYVHPSRWESHSTALLDVLSMGVPTVVSREMHIAPSLESAGAAFSSALDPRSLARAMTLLVSTGSELSMSAHNFVSTEMSIEAASTHWNKSYAALLP